MAKWQNFAAEIARLCTSHVLPEQKGWHVQRRNNWEYGVLWTGTGTVHCRGSLLKCKHEDVVNTRTTLTLLPSTFSRLCSDDDDWWNRSLHYRLLPTIIAPGHFKNLYSQDTHSSKTMLISNIVRGGRCPNITTILLGVSIWIFCQNPNNLFDDRWRFPPPRSPTPTLSCPCNTVLRKTLFILIFFLAFAVCFFPSRRLL